MKTVTSAIAAALLLGGMAFADDAQIPVTTFGGYFNSGLVINSSAVNNSSGATAFSNWSKDWGGWGNYAEAKMSTKAANWGFFIQPLYATANETNTISLYESYAWASPIDGLKIEIGTGNDSGIQDLDDNGNNGFNKAEGVTLDYLIHGFEFGVTYNGWSADQSAKNTVAGAPNLATLMGGFRWTDKNFTLNVYGGTHSTGSSAEVAEFDQLWATFSPNLPSFLSAWSISLGYDVSSGLMHSSTRTDFADVAITYAVTSALTVGVTSYGENLTNNVQNSSNTNGVQNGSNTQTYTARYFSYRPNVSYTVIADASGEHPVLALGAYFQGDTSVSPDYEPAVTAQWTIAPGAVLNLKAYYDSNTNSPFLNDGPNVVQNLPFCNSGVYSFAADFVYQF